MNTLQALTDKYLDGKTTIQEERELRQQLEAVANPDNEQRAIMMMLCISPKVAVMPDSATLLTGEREYSKVRLRRKRRTLFLRVGLPMAVAASLILAVLLIPNMDNGAAEKKLVAKASLKSETFDATQTNVPQPEISSGNHADKNERTQAVTAKKMAKQTNVQADDQTGKVVEENQDLAIAVEPAIITSRLKTNTPAGELHEINDLLPILQ